MILVKRKPAGIGVETDPGTSLLDAARRLRCRKADARRLDFIQDRSVDAVVSVHALHEMDRPVEVLREADRVLRGGGAVLVVDFPAPNAPLFATRLKGEWKHYTPDALQNGFKVALTQAGIPPEKYSIHCARHTAATFLYKRTKNLRLVQNILGHSSPSVTAHYAAIVNGWEALDEAGESGLYEEDA